MKNYVQPGDIVTVDAPYAVASGQGLTVAALFGVAMSDAAEGTPVPIKTTGVFDLEKVENSEFWPGSRVYWSFEDRVCQFTDGGANTLLIGVAIKYDSPESPTVRVRLGPPAPAVS